MPLLSPIVDHRLSDLSQEVLAKWTFLPTEPCPLPEGSHLPAEYITLLGPVTVVLRCESGVGALLAESFTGEPASEARARDAVKEFANLLCGHIQTAYVRRRPKGFAPFVPVPSSHYAWPQGAPTERCALRVEGLHLEVLLWDAHELGAAS
jgi:hypothetical protein